MENIKFRNRNGYLLPVYAPADEDGEEFTKCFINVIIDTSGSMKKHEAAMCSAMETTLSSLQNANANSIDTQFYVHLVTFNNDVTPLDSEYLEPSQVLSLMTHATLECMGGTNLGKVLSYMDKAFSRTGKIVQQLRKNDPKIMNLIITDFNGTDSASTRAGAMDLLSRNRLFQSLSHTLVVYVGDEAHKADALALAGGDERNIIQLSDDLSSLLAPILIGTTVSLSDGTHLNSSPDEKSPSELANESRQRAAEGSSSATQMSDTELRNSLLQLMGQTSA